MCNQYIFILFWLYLILNFLNIMFIDNIQVIFNNKFTKKFKNPFSAAVCVIVSNFFSN